jgi:zinc-ribbon domain
MAYLCEISPNQRIYLDCQGNNTIVTVMMGSPGQQQQSSNSFATGEWVSPPELFAASQGAVIKVSTAQDNYYIQVQGSSISLTTAACIDASQQMQIHQTDAPSAPPMTPMQPMQPMTMGMQMTHNPMEMRMGNMQMRMGESGQPASSVQSTPPAQSTPTEQSAQSPQATRKFCSQCGVTVEASDRFCSSCGHRLV